MKLAISTFGYDEGKSGMGIYIREIARRLSLRMGPGNVFLLGSRKDLEAIALPGNRTVIVPQFWTRPVTNLLWHFFVLPLQLLFLDVDILLLPAANRRATLFSPVSAVGVVHDLSQIHVPGKYDSFRMFYVLRILPIAFRRLRRIISVSKSTAADLVGRLGIPENRISVVLNGLDRTLSAGAENAACGTARTPDEKRPFFLYPARIEHPGKNHVRLLQAMKRMIARGEGSHDLVFVGKADRRHEEVLREISRLQLEPYVRWKGFVETQELCRLYRAASAVVFPSLYEGFGLPIIEAFQFGTPVVCSDIPVFREISGDAAWYFDPLSEESIADTLIQFCRSSEQERSERLRRSSSIANRFDWDRTAQETLDVLLAASRAPAPGGS